MLTKAAGRPDVAAVGMKEGREQKKVVCAGVDTVGKLADTGVVKGLRSYTARDVVWWSSTDEDSSVGGA